MKKNIYEVPELEVVDFGEEYDMMTFSVPTLMSVALFGATGATNLGGVDSGYWD